MPVRLEGIGLILASLFEFIHDSGEAPEPLEKMFEYFREVLSCMLGGDIPDHVSLIGKVDITCPFFYGTKSSLQM